MSKRIQTVTRLCTATVLAVCITARPLTVNAQPGAGSFREAVSVDVETQVIKTLETAREHIVESQWEPAVSILQELIDSSGNTLVPVEPGRYWNSSDYCHLLISQFPAAGLDAYRTRVDAQAELWFESGRQTLDRKLLLRVVNSAFNSSVGDDALWMLGELAFEQGHFAQARQHWSLLVPSQAPETTDPSDAEKPAESRPYPLGYLTHPDPSVAREEILARLILCSVFEGNRSRAQQELAVLRSEFPEATGAIAGQTGKLVGILEGTLRENAVWKQVHQSTRTETAPGGNASRSGIPKAAPKTEQLIWQRDLPVNRFLGPLPRTALEHENSSPYFPLTDGETVFVGGSDSVFAFDLATGQPKWPIDENDEGRIFSNILERPVMPHLPSAGLAWYSLCLHEGRLYARMGPPVMRRSRNEGNTFSEIVGLDVARREGELAFHVTSDVLDPDAESPEATSWSFEGAPLVSGDRVYVSARRGFPEDETVIACFDSNASRLLWRRRVCASLKNASDQFNLIGQNLLTLGDGRLFLDTGTGAIAALDAESGKLIWVVTYQPGEDETAHELSDPRRHGLAPCLFHQGVVYVAPDNSSLLLALDATTGQPVWRQPISDRVLHMAGVVDNRLILCGQAAWALDIRTGQAAWAQRIGFADPAGRGFGRPALSYDFLYWPTHDEILRIDHRLGQITGRIRLREDFGLTGGNLMIADDKLLIVQPEKLIALGRMQNDPPVKVNPEAGTQPQPATASETTRQGTRRADFKQAAYQRPAAGIRNEKREISTPVPDRAQASIQASSAKAVQETDQRSTGSPEQSSVPQDLWPVRQSWQIAVPPGASVRFPECHRATTSVGPIVASGAALKLLNPLNGQEQWTVSTSVPFDQTLSAHNVIAFSASSAVIARSQSDGGLLWRRILSHGAERIELRNGPGWKHLVIITESQATAVNWRTGSNVWQWPAAENHQPASKVAAARFPSDWIFSPDQLLYRPAGSAEHALIEMTNGELFRRGQLWLQPAALLNLPAYGKRSHTAIGGVDSAHNIRMTQLAELGVTWNHPVSGIAHGEPEIITDGQIMVVLEDRQFATRLDVESGQPLWRKSISRHPVESPSRTIQLGSNDLFVISNQIVRSISLKDGTQNWQQHLPSGQWSFQPADQALLCIRNSPLSNTSNAESSGSTIAVLDPSDGRILQRLNFESPIVDGGVSVQSDRAFVRSGDQLIAFEPWPITNVSISVP